jgi:hypothetical protein
MDGSTGAVNQELARMEMFSNILRGQTHTGSEAMMAAQNSATSGLLEGQDSVNISSGAYALAAAAAADTE